MNVSLKSYFFHSLLLLLLLLFVYSCEEDTECSFPATNVNTTYHYADLAQIGVPEYKIDTTVPGSYAGIIIFRKSQEEFIAYDLACPYELPAQCRLTIENTYTLVCPCCSSKFNLYYGSVDEGPARCGLKKYTTYYDRQNKTLHITEN